MGWAGWFFLPVLGWNFVGAWVLVIASTALGTRWGSLSPRKTYSGAAVIPIGVVIVDAQTGAIEKFDIASAPSWVDRIQPEDFVVEQLDNWGQYVRGWWNSLFARLDVIQSTPELKWTRVGDRVVIDFGEGKARSVLINGFDNPRLALVTGP